MAKDPAFLFYYQDFLVGTSFMTLEEVGAYIKLLCFQAAKGPLTKEDILKKIPAPIWDAICCNFILSEGLYFNPRLSEEIKKRSLYTESRRKNLHMDKHMDKHMRGICRPHMENENENENSIKNKGVVKGKINFIETLRENPAYKHINIDIELSKMDAWLTLPKNKGRKKTPQFILNWLNKIEAPIITKPLKREFPAPISTGPIATPEEVRANLKKARELVEGTAQKVGV